MDVKFILIVFQVMVLIMSIVVHEVAHGWAALKLGDPTAKYAGRLSLNPMKHLDPWGSFLVPLFMIVTLGFGFGWAKPVPYNPYNLKNQKTGPLLVALAGPLSNILLAVFFGLIARFITLNYMIKVSIAEHIFQFEDLGVVFSGSFAAIFFWLAMMMVILNVFLAFFNLIPIPPLDGSKLLFYFFSLKTETKIMLEQFGFIFLIMFIMIFSAPLGSFLYGVLSLFLRYIVGL
ncbi:MAG: site-2 protease family protein [Candidatus Moranbacteria bacterium]|nr:site-2 protease family protein [Candidatus Moranbacteria bacterium]